MLIESSELVDLLDAAAKCYFESLSGPGDRDIVFHAVEHADETHILSLTLDSDDHSDCCGGEDWNI
jgi:hypothetical protein